ncbi:MAG: hypothetical protein WCY34_02665 [Candidatus Omnitrophota bacterium]
MNNSKTKIIVTIGAIAVGCLVVALWLVLPLPFSVRNQAPVSSKEFLLTKIETEMDNMRMLLALRTNLGFIEAQDPAERIRDLCFDIDKEGWEKWSAIVDDMHSWYIRLAVEGNMSLEDGLNELYTKYPFLKLEGVEKQEDLGDMMVKTPLAGRKWNASSTVWQNIPGLLIAQKLKAGNVFVIFEGDIVVISSSASGGTASVRLVIDGDECDTKEIYAAEGLSGKSIMLTWRGELSAGKHNIKVQAKVSDKNIKLKSVDSRDIPKLVVIQ